MGATTALTTKRRTKRIPVQTVRLRLRMGAEDLGRRSFPMSYTVADVVEDLPNLTPEITCVVVNGNFRYPQPLTSAWRVTGCKSLFFTGRVPVKITDYYGRKIVRSANMPVLGLPVSELPVVASVATGIATTNEVIVDGKRLGGKRLRQAGLVEADHSYYCPDP